MSRTDGRVMREMLERVRVATGPDREINVALAVELTDWCRHEHTTKSGWQDDTGFTCDACGADSWGNKSASGQRLHDGCPAYTGSIDAAVALMERVLPGWDIHFYPEGDGQPGYVAELDWPPEAAVGDAGYFGINGRARTRPLAIVAAVLEAKLTLSERPALIAQEATDA